MGRVDLGYDGGRRKRKYFYGATRLDVAKKLNEALRDVQKGIPLADERQTTGDFLERWLTEVASQRLRPRTLRSYKQVVAAHIVPHLGRVPLARLTPQRVQKWLNDLQGHDRPAAGGDDDERDDENHVLSARTAIYARAILRSALTQATRWGLVTRNVAALVEPPRKPKGEIKPLDDRQARKLLRASTGHRLEALITVALALGLRQGEALGLRWGDIDKARRVLRVQRALQRVDGHLTFTEPKSERSNRTVALPDVVLKSLEKQRRRQARAKSAAGSRWVEDGLVFTSTIGTPLEPRNVTREFHDLLERAGLPHVRFHDLRHTAATLLLAQGVDPRTIMETLGHSQISLTMDTYSHVLPRLQREAANRMDSVLKTATRKRTASS
jgi:integrase